MPRKIFSKITPKKETIEENKYIKMLGHRINNPKLWGLDRRSVAKAIAISLFIAFIPMPMQMLAVAVLAVIIKMNLPISVLMVWVTNPFTMPFIYYAEYYLGHILIGGGEMNFEFSLDWINANFHLLMMEMYLGAFVISTTLMTLSYLIVMNIWRVIIFKERRDKQKEYKKG